MSTMTAQPTRARHTLRLRDEVNQTLNSRLAQLREYPACERWSSNQLIEALIAFTLENETEWQSFLAAQSIAV